MSEGHEVKRDEREWKCEAPPAWGMKNLKIKASGNTSDRWNIWIDRYDIVGNRNMADVLDDIRVEWQKYYCNSSIYNSMENNLEIQWNKEQSLKIWKMLFSENSKTFSNFYSSELHRYRIGVRVSIDKTYVNAPSSELIIALNVTKDFLSITCKKCF